MLQANNTNLLGLADLASASVCCLLVDYVATLERNDHSTPGSLLVTWFPAIYDELGHR